jgi:malate synthase
MEDAATAEIARSQVWQWVRHGVRLAEGAPVTTDLVRRIQADELATFRQTLGDATFGKGHFAAAGELFEAVALGQPFVEFLTLPAYDRIDL